MKKHKTEPKPESPLYTEQHKGEIHMNNTNVRNIAASPYIHQAIGAKRKAIIMLIIKTVLLVACIIGSENKLMPACLFMMVLRIGKQVGLWNRERSYLVDEYSSDGAYMGSFWANGTFIGGLLKWLIAAGAALYMGEIFLEKHFPVDIPGFRFAITAAAFWVMAVPMLDEVLDIINANKLIEEVYTGQRGIRSILAEQEDRRDELHIRFHVVMAVLVVCAVIFQFISLWVGGGIREKRFDDTAYGAYLEYCEKRSENPVLSQALFEEHLDDEHEYKKYRSETVFTVIETLSKNGSVYNRVNTFTYEYYDKAWHVTDMQQRTGDVHAANISGVWAGAGDDLYMAYNSGDIRSVIALDSMSADRAAGYITATFRGETMYYAAFTGTVTQENGYLVVNAMTDEEFSGYYSRIEVAFAYDPENDTIVYATHAPEIVFERQ